jgi:hypothetical protein
MPVRTRRDTTIAELWLAYANSTNADEASSVSFEYVYPSNKLTSRVNALVAELTALTETPFYEIHDLTLRVIVNDNLRAMLSRQCLIHLS